jgi:hypothetical protein
MLVKQSAFLGTDFPEPDFRPASSQFDGLGAFGPTGVRQLCATIGL